MVLDPIPPVHQLTSYFPSLCHFCTLKYTALKLIFRLPGRAQGFKQVIARGNYVIYNIYSKVNSEVFLGWVGQ